MQTNMFYEKRVLPLSKPLLHLASQKKLERISSYSHTYLILMKLEQLFERRISLEIFALCFYEKRVWPLNLPLFYLAFEKHKIQRAPSKDFYQKWLKSTKYTAEKNTFENNPTVFARKMVWPLTWPPNEMTK